MAITLEHFCTKTGKPIIIDGQPVTETIEHCLAEYLAPNATYKIGAVYQGITTEADLQKFSEQGLSLQFAADDRFYFMNKQLREKIFDQPHFGAAYGSNMFTPCKSFEEQKNLRVLIVDAATGENGGILPKEEAIKLVGDGDGKIDAKLHEFLGNALNTPFQTRFGIKSRISGLEPNGNTPVNETWQLGKGTFAPRDLSQVGNKYDLIISTDQLKGRKNKENQLGILGEDGKSLKVGNEIKPGEYTMTIGIGNKTDAYLGITSTGLQFWNSFPTGVQNDVLPRLEKRLEELKEMASDPRKIARDYIKAMDRRNKYRLQEESTSEQEFDFDNLDLDAFDKLVDKVFGSSDQELMYRILKADLDGHCQVLELPKVISKLQEHWREQYLDCATGRFIKFDSAMAQTCHELAENEVCIPNYPDGAEVIVYRGPTANSNTVDVYVNKHLANEPQDTGTIKMSPKGLKHSLSDCDGDRMAYALASEFPHTAAEIKECQKAENRYAEIVKLDKKAYSGSFEQIALDAMENKIGIIANLCMKGIALENECVSVPNEEAFKLMWDMSIAAVGMLQAETDPKKPIIYPSEIRKQIVELASFYQDDLKQGVNLNQFTTLAEYNSSRTERNLSLLDEAEVNKFIEKSRHFYHEAVGLLGGQLQIEVDRGKSANRSDPTIINACNAIIKSFDLAPWVEEKKVDEVYVSKPLTAKGHGAIDLMIRPTNEAFEEGALVARSTQQFQDLFKGIEYTPAQKDKAAELKRTYDTLLNRAIEITREVEEAPGPRILATSGRGNSIEIIGLAEFKHPNAFDTNRKFDIKLVENNNPNAKVKNKWITLAPVFDASGKPELKNGELKYTRLGYIATESANKYPERMKQWGELKGLTPEILPGLTQAQAKAAFKQAKEFAMTAKETIPKSQTEAVAAAMWELSTSGKDEQATKKSSAAFAMFGDEIAGRLHKLQFTDFAVVGTHKPSNEHLGRRWVGEKTSCEIIQAPDPANPEQNKRWFVAEGKKLGVFRSESAQLPIGTQFEATITSPPGASVIVTSSKGNQLKVGQLKKYAFADREWHGEAGVVTIQIQNGKSSTALALVDGKPLGVIDKESMTQLTQKLSEKGVKVHSFQFQATLESAPATIANLKVDPETVKYPVNWTREEPLVKNKRLSLTDALKPLLIERYPEKSFGLMHDDEANFKAYLLSGDEWKPLMQAQGKETDLAEALSNEINRKFGAESFLGIAQKDNRQEQYFGILIPTARSEEKTAARLVEAFNFPLEYEQMQQGQHIKLIAVPLDEMLALLSTTKEMTQPNKEVNQNAATDKSNHIAPELITNLAPHQVFVFGSNTEGRHGAGAAKEAVKFGAEYGNPSGVQGQSYAIVTKDLAKGKRSVPLSDIEAQIDQFLELAAATPEKEFLVTKIGCSLAGYSESEIAALWQEKPISNNVKLPAAFITDKTQLVDVELGSTTSNESHTSKNPLSHLQPLSSSVAPHFSKDVAMAEIATQFIGISSAPPDTPSSTRNYQEAWSDRANTGIYSKDDIVMVLGSGPWRRIGSEQIQQTLQQHYVPLLEKAVEAKASFVVGDAKGCDQLVQQFLQERGYNLESDRSGFLKATPNLQAVATSKTADNQETSGQLHQATAGQVPQEKQLTQRTEWEKEMLKQALASLKANAANTGEELQTSTFNDGKYRVILHKPTETLQIVDEVQGRGTLYKAQKEKSATKCEFTDAEKEIFAQLYIEKLQQRQNLQRQSQAIERE